MKHGVDIDTAFAMPRHLRKAWIIVIGQSEGNEFDWDRMRWKKRD